MGEELLCSTMPVPGIKPPILNRKASGVLPTYHRITEWVGFAGTLKPSRSCHFDLTAMGRDTFHCPRLSQALPSLALNASRDGAAKTALGNFCPIYHSLLPAIYSFRISHLSLPSISVKPFPLVLSLHPLVQRASPALLHIL